MYTIWWWWWAQLAPQCSEVLLRCVWKGTVLNCSDEKTAFRQVVSETGACCLFNSVKVLDKFTVLLSPDPLSIYLIVFCDFKWIRSQKVGSTSYGKNSGLIVYVNTSVADYFFTTEPFIGFRVSFLSFDGYKYLACFDLFVNVLLIFPWGDAPESRRKSWSIGGPNSSSDSIRNRNFSQNWCHTVAIRFGYWTISDSKSSLLSWTFFGIYFANYARIQLIFFLNCVLAEKMPFRRWHRF